MTFGFALISNFEFPKLALSTDGVNKMSWDYRVIFAPYEAGSDEGEYTIREVYYDDEGEISWFADEGVEFVHEDFWELADDFDAVAEAFDKPVLILIDGDLIEDDEEESEDDE